MKKTIITDGNTGTALSSYIFTEIAGIYPITPSCPMPESTDVWATEGKKNMFNDTVKIIEMQSEAGAAGLVHGALQTGALATTYTASQGLLLMIPNMYKIAGEMLPGVIHVAARSISTHALSIFGDHQDVYAARSTGFAMLSSNSVQDTVYMASLAHLAAIKSSIPFMHFFEGFRTSHELQKIETLEDKDFIKLLDKNALEKFRKKALNPRTPVTRGTSQTDDVYFQTTEARNLYYTEVPIIVNDYMEKINDIAGTNYKPFNYYGSGIAENIIVAMGSVCETIKETIDELNNNDYNVGLIEVHLFRPFSEEFFLNVLPPNVKNVAVLDRTKEPGSIGEPLYLDVSSILKSKGINVYGGRYGLSSKNTIPSDIKAVYDFLTEKPHHDFTIGIIDDVTNLSLKRDSKFKINNAKEFLIYGYGSDGMVTAAKSIVTAIGDNTNLYIQNYSQFDPKKSGGVTLSHIRISDKPIKATYYVENPELVVVTKDSYIKDFDVLSGIKENGVFVVNTVHDDETFISNLPNKVKKIIMDRNITVYLVNAYELADKVGIKNKINTTMETIIMKIIDILDFEKVKNDLKENAKEHFSHKGKEVVEANYKAIDEAINYYRELDNSKLELTDTEETSPSNVIVSMNKRKGNSLPTSVFLKNADGTYPAGTSVIEKRAISDLVPFWLSEKCIQCNLCSFDCPHGVIRPYILDQKEYDESPNYVKDKCIKAMGKEGYYYTIALSVKDCTGCGLCIKECPGMKGDKALIVDDLYTQIENKEQERFDYLNKNINDKKLYPEATVKGTQFKKPKFEFSGACAGCGETPYLKVLTQMYGDNLVIANATGCSSIYGASAPSTPYTVPWASSLFEDNAEFGFGMQMATDLLRKRIAEDMETDKENPNKKLYDLWLNDPNNYETTKKVYDELDYTKVSDTIKSLKEYIPSRVIFQVGGDGWAYDIGYGGIDHVLASDANINILVLDTQVYSNTGGQASKATPTGAIAAFAASGKKQASKDLASIAMMYPNVYVAKVSLGYNPQLVVKALEEAVNHNGPSIIIAYAPCIAHGIKGGMVNSIEQEKLAAKSGYFPTFRYNPDTKKFTLDSKDVDFNLYEDFLLTQNRYKSLKNINPTFANDLLKKNKEDAISKYEYYKSLDNTVDEK